MTDTTQVLDEKATAVVNAIISCPHEIETAFVTLRFDENAPEHNALSQLHRRVADALSALSSKPSDEGWIEWKGGPEGECPVGQKCLVDIRWNDRSEVFGRLAGTYRWKQLSTPYIGPDIIAYRVVQP